ncbi:GspH/FimT family pseudopilin [Novosphingobium sp. KCTC 2891]|uniref:GspH/FimT family pseudopilin n=1 Tax=Novosphingobium sp. KCTC 2891 TaxID=2989730 RepID=UPI00222131E2|nr:GspH/FimT family pseudopilin [Novosphingobium sp. KCTC 2891]MCW1382800.1 GspH/FimT family pseudopilin [Novosphingobium sp. KCTC 2891]
MRPTPAPKPIRNAFSLVEMMVVLFVMGVLAAAIVMVLPGDEARLRGEAERLAARTLAARDEAIAAGAPVSLVVSGAGYYFEERRGGTWQPAHGRGLGLTPWDEGTRVSLGLAGGQDGGRTRVVFDPVGLASSDVSVRMARGAQARVLTIARDGRVRLDGGR